MGMCERYQSTSGCICNTCPDSYQAKIIKLKRVRLTKADLSTLCHYMRTAAFFTTCTNFVCKSQHCKSHTNEQTIAYPWGWHAWGRHAWPLGWHARSEACRRHILRSSLPRGPLCKLRGWHARSWGSTYMPHDTSINHSSTVGKAQAGEQGSSQITHQITALVMLYFPTPVAYSDELKAA